MDSQMDSQTVEGAANLVDLATNMMVKFEKYWHDYSVVLALGAVLDPRIKLSTLEFCYSKVDPHTSKLKVDEVKKKLYNLFENYSSISNSSTTTSTSIASSATSSTHKLTSNLFSALKEHNQQLATLIGNSQLDDLNVLQWWKENRYRFKDLSLMARDLLGIPITTVASESAFSIGSIILNKYRSRLLSENVEALICTRNWLHGFNSSAVVGDDEEKDGGSGRFQPMPMASTSTEASYVYDIDDDDDE